MINAGQGQTFGSQGRSDILTLPPILGYQAGSEAELNVVDYPNLPDPGRYAAIVYDGYKAID